MIEVLFGESEAASMKVAKSKAIHKIEDGSTAVLGRGQRSLPRPEHTGWMEGSPDEVICLGFLLDIGDIGEAVDSDYRKELIYSLYARGAWSENEDMDRELRQLCDVYCGELDRLKSFLAAGEDIRIWYSSSPYSLCGFYHLCSILQSCRNKISVVKLPECVVKPKCIVTLYNWGEVAAEEFAGFLTEERPLPPEEIRMYSSRWNELKKDGSHLRALVNGTLLGVPETFYDFLIWRRLGSKPIKQARLIGDILGSTPVGVSDIWYEKGWIFSSSRERSRLLRIQKTNMQDSSGKDEAAGVGLNGDSKGMMNRFAAEVEIGRAESRAKGFDEVYFAPCGVGGSKRQKQILLFT